MAPGAGRGLEAAPLSPRSHRGVPRAGVRGGRAAPLAVSPVPVPAVPRPPGSDVLASQGGASALRSRHHQTFRRPRPPPPPPGTWHRQPGAEPRQHPRPGQRHRGQRGQRGRHRGRRGQRGRHRASAAVAGTHRGALERTGQSGEGRPEAAEPVPMCPRSRRGDEAAMSAAGAGTVRPWKPDPGQADGGRPPPGPALPLTLSVLAWLGTGTTMAGLNKWIFAAHGFRYPLLLSALHMLSGVAVGYPLGWARAPGPRPRARIYLLSLTFCTSVALGNLGLSYVQLDVAQAVATTTPLVTLVLGLLGGRRPHPLQFWAMGPVCAGAACSIAGGLCFSQPGCGFLLAATVLRALKSIQQSVLLQEDRLDALSLLGLTSLPSFVLLFGAAVALELGPSWQGVLRPDAALWGCVLLSCLGSVLYNLATSCLLSLTSALTLHLLGSLTVVGNLLLSWLLFGTRLGALGYAGVALTLAGMVLYHQPRLLAACWGLRGLRRHPRHE